MTDVKKITGEIAKISKSEKIRNYLIGIGAMTGLILGLVSQFKGEPYAEKTWKVLQARTNEHSEKLNRLHIRMVSFQAVQEVRSIMELDTKLTDLQKKHDELLGKLKSQKKVPAPALKMRLVSINRCRRGQIKGADGHCRDVHKAVEAKVKAVEKQEASAREALKSEKKKRMKAEKGKKYLMKRLLQQAEAKPIKALPATLEEASK